MAASSLAALIRAEAESRGRLTFAEFMAMALYHPAAGYYTRSGRVGEGGDFYTSPAAHPAFGALLCAQLWRMWQWLGCPSRFTTVELGAGDGLLARDVCSYADRLSPQFAAALSYVAVDVRRPSGPSQPSDQVQPIVSDRLPLRGVIGCIIANELLDALPFHRFRIIEGALQEVYVVPDSEGGLAEELGEPSTPLLAERLERPRRNTGRGISGRGLPRVAALAEKRRGGAGRRLPADDRLRLPRGRAVRPGEDGWNPPDPLPAHQWQRPIRQNRGAGHNRPRGLHVGHVGGAGGRTRACGVRSAGAVPATPGIRRDATATPSHANRRRRAEREQNGDARPGEAGPGWGTSGCCYSAAAETRATARSRTLRRRSRWNRRCSAPSTQG